MTDLLERSLWTGVEAGLGVATVDALSTFDATTGQTLAVAGIAIIYTAIKVFARGRLKTLSNGR